jgi:isopenicillin N synthase-like dioxygenase
MKIASGYIASALRLIGGPPRQVVAVFALAAPNPRPRSPTAKASFNYKDRHAVREAAVETSERLTSSYLENSNYSQSGQRTPRTPDPERFLEALSALGYAFWQLSGAESQALNRLHSEATSFFHRDQDSKRKHLSPGLNFGYRPFGRQYSAAPRHPNINESFAYWDDGPEAIPKAPKIAPFISALGGYSHVVARITDFILRHIAISLASSQRLEFEGNSHIEINWYFPTKGEDLIEERHEDGHLLTILTMAGQGLEIECAGQMMPVKLSGSELLVMPGSLLTDMTGGWISPLYHQVRNQHLSPLLSITYLVNPLLDRPIGPFAINDSNRSVDIAARARAKPQVGRQQNKSSKHRR